MKEGREDAPFVKWTEGGQTCGRDDDATNVTVAHNMTAVSATERKADNRTKCTEPGKSLGTWLREISSCSCLTVLPGPAWLLLNNICIPLFWALY